MKTKLAVCAVAFGVLLAAPCHAVSTADEVAASPAPRFFPIAKARTFNGVRMKNAPVKSATSLGVKPFPAPVHRLPERPPAAAVSPIDTKPLPETHAQHILSLFSSEGLD